MNTLFRFVFLMLVAAWAQAAEPAHDHQHSAPVSVATPKGVAMPNSATPNAAMSHEACQMMPDVKPGMGPRGNMMGARKPCEHCSNQHPAASEHCQMHQPTAPCTKCESVQQRLKAVERRLEALERAAKPATK